MAPDRGMMILRPNLVQELLKDCKSVKVKHLFHYLAEKHDHNWLKRLDVSDIDLGKGKRQIIKGGMLDKKYQITVPDVLGED